jgi:hypothetical protein
MTSLSITAFSANAECRDVFYSRWSFSKSEEKALQPGHQARHMAIDHEMLASFLPSKDSMAVPASDENRQEVAECCGKMIGSGAVTLHKKNCAKRPKSDADDDQVPTYFSSLLRAVAVK